MEKKTTKTQAKKIKIEKTSLLHNVVSPANVESSKEKSRQESYLTNTFACSGHTQATHKGEKLDKK